MHTNSQPGSFISGSGVSDGGGSRDGQSGAHPREGAASGEVVDRVGKMTANAGASAGGASAGVARLTRGERASHPSFLDFGYP